MEFSSILSRKTILLAANTHTTAFPKWLLVQEINIFLLKWVSSKYTLYISVIFDSVSTLAGHLCTYFSFIYTSHQNEGYICRQGCATTSSRVVITAVNIHILALQSTDAKRLLLDATRTELMWLSIIVTPAHRTPATSQP